MQGEGLGAPTRLQRSGLSSWMSEGTMSSAKSLVPTANATPNNKHNDLNSGITYAVESEESHPWRQVIISLCSEGRPSTPPWSGSAGL